MARKINNKVAAYGCKLKINTIVPAMFKIKEFVLLDLSQNG